MTDDSARNEVSTRLQALQHAIRAKVTADLQAQGPDAVQRYNYQTAELRRQLTDLSIDQEEAEANLAASLPAAEALLAAVQQDPVLAKGLFTPAEAKAFYEAAIALEQQRQDQQIRHLRGLSGCVLACGDPTISQLFTEYIEALIRWEREKEAPPAP